MQVGERGLEIGLDSKSDDELPLSTGSSTRFFLLAVIIKHCLATHRRFFYRFAFSSHECLLSVHCLVTILRDAGAPGFANKTAVCGSLKAFSMLEF